MSELHRITVRPEQGAGRPCIRGLRVRVKDILDQLASGASRDEILADYPYLEAEDITGETRLGLSCKRGSMRCVRPCSMRWHGVNPWSKSSEAADWSRSSAEGRLYDAQHPSSRPGSPVNLNT